MWCWGGKCATRMRRAFLPSPELVGLAPPARTERAFKPVALPTLDGPAMWSEGGIEASQRTGVAKPTVRKARSAAQEWDVAKSLRWSEEKRWSERKRCWTSTPRRQAAPLCVPRCVDIASFLAAVIIVLRDLRIALMMHLHLPVRVLVVLTAPPYSLGSNPNPTIGAN
jgi:hypothetical protein